VFSPPFATPVVLRLQAAPPGDANAVDVFRQFRLDIPSAVGFWDASPTGGVNETGRIQVRIRGYGPMSARTMELAIKDSGGRDIATATARIVFNGNLPGAAAGQILGLGSFDTTVWLPSNPIGPLSIWATWRDATSGARLRMDTALPTSAV
jgi:hypothetical protein